MTRTFNKGFPYTFGDDGWTSTRQRHSHAAGDAGVDAGQLKKLVTAVAKSGDADVARFW